MTRTTSLLAVLAIALGTTAAMAEDMKYPERSTGSATEGPSSGDTGTTSTGNPSESGTNENVQPGPLEEGPADPAAADNPKARVPTTEPE